MTLLIPRAISLAHKYEFKPEILAQGTGPSAPSRGSGVVVDAPPRKPIRAFQNPRRKLQHGPGAISAGCGRLANWRRDATCVRGKPNKWPPTHPAENGGASSV